MGNPKDTGLLTSIKHEGVGAACLGFIFFYRVMQQRRYFMYFPDGINLQNPQQTIKPINQPLKELTENLKTEALGNLDTFVQKRLVEKLNITKVEEGMTKIADKLKKVDVPAERAVYTALAKRTLGIHNALPPELKINRDPLQVSLERSLTRLLESFNGSSDIDPTTYEMLEELAKAGAGLEHFSSEGIPPNIYTLVNAPLSLGAKFLFLDATFKKDPLSHLAVLLHLYHSENLVEQQPQVVDRIDHLFRIHGKLDLSQSQVNSFADHVFSGLRWLCGQHRSRDALRFLFENEVCSNKDLYGWLFHEVTEHGSDVGSIAELMITRGIRHPLVTELEFGSDYTAKQIKQLVNAGAVDLNATSHQGNTLLHLAVRRGDQDLAFYLLSKYLDPDAENHDGETPRSMAKENPAMADFLEDCELGKDIKG